MAFPGQPSPVTGTCETCVPGGFECAASVLFTSGLVSADMDEGAKLVISLITNPLKFNREDPESPSVNLSAQPAWKKCIVLRIAWQPLDDPLHRSFRRPISQ